MNKRINYFMIFHIISLFIGINRISDKTIYTLGNKILLIYTLHLRRDIQPLLYLYRKISMGLNGRTFNGVSKKLIQLWDHLLFTYPTKKL